MIIDNEPFYPPRRTTLDNNAVPSIDALRFLFMCVICLWHCHPLSPWLHNGFIAVEFYFMVSGFLMYQSFLRHPNVGVLDFTLKKIKRFAIPFWISILSLMVIDRKRYIFLSCFTPDEILETWFSHFHEFFFCQCMGLTDRIPINHPLWFLSVLLFGGAVLYSILRNCPKTSTSLVIPLVCMIGFPLYLNSGKLQIDTIIPGMVRGVSEMGLGIMTAVVLQRKKGFVRRHCMLSNLISVGALMLFLLMMFAEKRYDYLLPFVIPLILLGAFTESSWLNAIFRAGPWHWLNDLSMYMYFIHLLIASLYFIFCNSPFLVGIPTPVLTLSYLMVVFVSAYLLRCSSKILMLKFF